MPYEGELPATDLFIPYDQIADAAELPDDRDTGLAVYCETGRMSGQAALTLLDLGYTRLFENSTVAWLPGVTADARYWAAHRRIPPAEWRTCSVPIERDAFGHVVWLAHLIISHVLALGVSDWALDNPVLRRYRRC